MEKLAPEVLHQIFIKLSLIQKQECMYVCSKWRSLIFEFSLFQSVYFPNKHVYNKFIKLAQKEPSVLKQVEYIKAYYGPVNFCHTAWLLHLFPNLREIELSHSPTTPIHKVTREFNPVTRKSYITYLRDYERCILNQLIVSDHCQYLVTLVLKLVTYFNIPESIPALLKHMPRLKHLSLEGNNVSMSDCETICANLPSLESLDLHRAIATPSSIDTLQYVEPAKSLRKFTVNSITVGWTKYILEKCPSLEHLEFSAYDYNEDIAPLFKKLDRKLKTLNLLDMGGCSDDVVNYLYSLGSQLKTLKIQSGDRADFIVRTLSRSNSAFFIENLTIRDMLPSSFNWLQSLVKLEKFEMHYDKYNSDSRIDLYAIFKHLPPSVKKTVMYFYQTKAILPKVPQQFSVKELEINTDIPSIGIDDLISNCFPNLNRLILRHCFMPNAIVMLQKHRLSYLEIKHSSNVALTVGKKAYYYNVRSGRKTKYTNDYTSLSEEYSPVLLDTVRSEEFVYIICRSVDTFVFNDSLASFLSVRLDQLQDVSNSKQKNIFSKLSNVIR